jgi:acyl-coenzyme A synthetase/AMP-(fatty) acid ligase
MMLSILQPLTIEHLTLVQRFDAVAELHPDRPAVVANAEALDYSSLRLWSTQIARSVHQNIASGERPVALFLGHCAAGIAAILGVARSGRPFLVLDSSLPGDRLHQMLRLTGAELCLFDTETEPLVRQLAFAVPTLKIPPRDGNSTFDFATTWHPSERACFLVTSGSTGTPKAVIWRQSTLMKDALAGLRFFRFYTEDRIALVLPYSFAGGLSVVLWGLTSGASLHLFDTRAHTVSELIDWITLAGCTTLHTTPTLLRSVLHSLSPTATFPQVRLVTTCGEPVHATDVKRLRHHLSFDATFANWTGSTEVGVLAINILSGQDSVEDGFIKAGNVVDGIQIAFLPVTRAPDQVTESSSFGELVVISDHIAIGYCGDGSADSEKFATANGRRSYRTGDLAKIDDTGEWILRGRRDAAIKIRGYLVEPREAEAALLACPNVAEAHVAVREVAPSDSRLVGYVVASPGTVLSVNHVRSHLRQSPPIYLIPTSIIEVAAFPRTERGKIDTRRLLSVSAVGTSSQSLPTTPWEVWLTEIWRKVLNLDKIGIDDDFFELGGDSLAVAEVLYGTLRNRTRSSNIGFCRRTDHTRSRATNRSKEFCEARSIWHCQTSAR